MGKLKLYNIQTPIGKLPELLTFDEDGLPKVALRDLSPQRRKEGYFKQGDYVVIDMSNLTSPSFGKALAVKGVVAQVNEKHKWVEVEVVSDNGVLQNIRKRLAISSPSVWRWNEKVTPFIPQGYTLRERQYIFQLELPRSIEHALLMHGSIFTIEELERAFDQEVLSLIPGIDESTLGIIQKALTNYRSANQLASNGTFQTISTTEEEIGETLKDKTASHRLNGEVVATMDKLRLIRTLYELGWLEPSFRKGFEDDANTYDYAIARDKINIVAFSAEYVERNTLSFLEDVNNLEPGKIAVIITTSPFQKQRLTKNPEIIKAGLGKKIFIARLRRYSQSDRQWSALLGKNDFFDFGKMTKVKDIVDNRDLIQAIADVV